MAESRPRQGPPAVAGGPATAAAFPGPRATAPGTSGTGLRPTFRPRSRGNVSRKHAPRPGSPHASSFPLCRLRVLDADREAQTGAAGTAHPRRVGAPEPVEHQLLLARTQTDALVADHERQPRCRRPAGEAESAFPHRGRSRWRADSAGSARPGVDRRRPSTGSSGMSTISSVAVSRARWRTVDTAARAHMRTSSCSEASSATPASWRRDLEEVAQQSPRTGRVRRRAVRTTAFERRDRARRCRRGSDRRPSGPWSSGVRSSWLTSDVNRFCRLPNSSSWVICFDRLSAISLNDMASRAMSSSPRTGMRSLSRPSANRTAMRDADRIGSTTWRATSIEIAASSTSSTPAPISSVPRTSARLRSSPPSGNTRYSSSVEMADVGRAADDQHRAGVSVRVRDRRELVADLPVLNERAQILRDLLGRSARRRRARTVTGDDEHRVERAGDAGVLAAVWLPRLVRVAAPRRRAGPPATPESSAPASWPSTSARARSISSVAASIFVFQQPSVIWLVSTTPSTRSRSATA